MKRYIKIDNNNTIIDIFMEIHSANFDGYEIFFDEVDFVDYKINDKYISDEWGNFIFQFDGENVTEINPFTDPDILLKYKLLKRDELYALMWPSVIEGNRILDDIITQWAAFKANASSWTTKEQVDAAFKTAKTWLGF